LPRPIYLLSPVKKEGAQSLPMISFETIAQQIDFTVCDTLMFTSKQAVLTADKIDPRWREYPAVTIGKATADLITARGGNVVYQPENFYGETLSRDIVTYFKKRKILYLRPKEVSFDAKSYLAQEGIQLHEQIIYQTMCITYPKEKQPDENAVIIFTSPSTIRCFLKNFRWHPHYTAVVIGHATRQHLPEGADVVIADQPLIDACVEKAREISLDSNPK
jgi:uroporphyrinogen-III synthase